MCRAAFEPMNHCGKKDRINGDRCERGGADAGKRQRRQTVHGDKTPKRHGLAGSAAIRIILHALRHIGAVGHFAAIKLRSSRRMRRNLNEQAYAEKNQRKCANDLHATTIDRSRHKNKLANSPCWLRAVAVSLRISQRWPGNQHISVSGPIGSAVSIWRCSLMSHAYIYMPRAALVGMTGFQQIAGNT